MALIASCTDIGIEKQSNQDSHCILVADTLFGEVICAAVCDGVGGLTEGDIASASTISRFSTWVNENLAVLLSRCVYDGQYTLAALEGALTQLLQGIHQDLFSYGNAYGKRTGTTFSGIIASQGNYLIAHVGDSRIYKVAPQGVQLLTQDQTLAARNDARGGFFSKRKGKQAEDNVLLQAIGGQESLKADFSFGAYDASETFVICSDGAYRSNQESIIQGYFNPQWVFDEPNMDMACRNLIQRSIASGERDNLTALCFRPTMPINELESETEVPAAQNETVPSPGDSEMPTTGLNTGVH